MRKLLLCFTMILFLFAGVVISDEAKAVEAPDVAVEQVMDQPESVVLFEQAQSVTFDVTDYKSEASLSGDPPITSRIEIQNSEFRVIYVYTLEKLKPDKHTIPVQFGYYLLE